LSNYVLKLKY